MMIRITTLRSAVGFTALMAIFTLTPVAVSPATAAEAQARLTRKEARRLTATATTREDHLVLAQYFTREAVRLDAESRQHQQLANEYRHSRISQAMAMKNPMGPRTAAHCEFYAKSTARAAQEARVSTAGHQRMADDASR